jgi:hypothetical protein
VRQLTDGARHYWKLYKEAVHRDLICSDHSENIKSFFRKLAEHAARMAGLLHYFDGKPGDVSPEAMKSAIALCEWYAFEFFNNFSEFAPSRQQMENEAAQKLLAWLQEAFANPVRYSKIRAGQYTERDLNNYSPIRNDPTKLALAIDVLQRQGLIVTGYGKKGGRVVFYPPSIVQYYAQGGFGMQPMNYSAANSFIAPSVLSSGNSKNRGFARFDNLPPYQGTSAENVSPPQSGQSHVEPQEIPVTRTEYDTEELRAVKRHAEKSAFENLGPAAQAIYRVMSE